MYFDESPEYLYTMYDKATKRRLTGTIGDIPFAGVDVVRGSFEVTNRCASDSDMKIGGVYIGQLNMTFVPSFVNKLPRKNYIGKEIRPSIGLYVPDNEAWEDIPLGVFTVKSADVSKNGITIEAYDNMSKFDIPFVQDEAYGTAYDFLKYISLECGVELGVTKNYINSLPNGEDELFLVEQNDIETFRDFLYWIAQTTATFATIDRDGKLVLRQFGLGTTEMDETNRDVDAVYSDFVTKYTEISMYDNDAGETQYYSVAPNDGLTMDLGANPLLQTVADADTQEAIDYLEEQIQECERIIGEIDAEIELLGQQLDEVEEALREHPDDPELLARKALLEGEIAVKEDEKLPQNKKIEEYTKDIEELEQGIIARSKIFKKRARRNILREVKNIRYTPFSVVSARDPIFDLGDLIVFTGGMANEETGCIMALSYKLDSYAFEGYGGNPELSSARSKTDKAVTGNKKSEEKNIPIDFGYYVNIAPLTIRKNQEVTIGQLNFGLSKDTDVETWVELKLETTQSDDRKKGIKLHYYLDGQEITAYNPVEEWEDLGIRTDFTLDNETLVFSSYPEEALDNYHTVNFQFHLVNITAAQMHTWKVTAESTNGVEIVDTECGHIVIWAEGLKSEKDWEGLFKANDTYPVYPIMGMPIFDTIEEVVNVTVSGEADTIITEDGDNLTTEAGANITTANINDLPNASTLDGTEYIPIVQNGSTVKITTQDLADL